jgi:hypothetical protein
VEPNFLRTKASIRAAIGTTKPWKHLKPMTVGSRLPNLRRITAT